VLFARPQGIAALACLRRWLGWCWMRGEDLNL
jgi:hypothetical protein